MTFTTVTFLLFFGAVFGLYWALRQPTAQNLLLVVASFGFYAWWDYRFTVLMLISSVIDFSVGLGLARARGTAARRALLLCSVTGNLGMLGFFKYSNFFIESFQGLLGQLGLHADPFTLRVILPVGISFYTFQTMSYTLDVYRGTMTPTRRFIDYLAYVTFFPQLVAGPIERPRHLLTQFFSDRKFDYDLATDGARQILWGFFKKLVIADNLAAIVNPIYADPTAATGPQLTVATVAFAFQIYADFSAYSDIAIGTAKLFGIDLVRNFAHPYFSQSVGEFWRRWHISLSTWFRDYVYIPIGGKHGSPLRRFRNIMATFLVSGLWHGASWNFVIWGGLHGLAAAPGILTGRQRNTALDRPGGERAVPDPRTLWRMARTFGVVCVAWVFFRAETLGDAWTILRTMAADAFSLADYYGVRLVLDWYDRTTLVLVVAFVVFEWVQRRQPHGLVLHWPRWARWVAYTALLWLTVSRQGPPGDFIYFQF